MTYLESAIVFFSIFTLYTLAYAVIDYFVSRHYKRFIIKKRLDDF